MLSPAHWQAGRALGPYSDRGSAISPKLNCQMHRRCNDRSGSHSAVCPPSRPEEFHPEPLTEPDLILSHHPAHAIARRLPPSIDHWAHPVAGWPMLKGNDLPPSLQPHYRASITTTKQFAPDRRIDTFSLAGSPLAPFPLASPARFPSSTQEPR
jgi:hypothetical protein